MSVGCRLGGDSQSGQLRLAEEESPVCLGAVLFLHGVGGTVASFFQQMRSLGAKGYDVFSVQWPAVRCVGEFVDALDAFLEEVGLPAVHIVAADLGGYLAQAFTTRRPCRVLSLFLINSYRWYVDKTSKPLTCQTVGFDSGRCRFSTALRSPGRNVCRIFIILS
eukprot:GHVT01020897.1.p1 GENE.GHVT01020897.1~~GHVT01020897.1.p1  ORF type:complete len:164 (-),score=9.60 GHVT01020897.1:585-1076(-)